MTRKLALLAIFLSVALIAGAYAAAFLPGGAPEWAAWLMAIGTSGVMVATMALGAARDRGLGRLLVPFTFVFMVLAGGFCLVLLLPTQDSPTSPLWLGLPPRAAIILYGVGLLPLFAVPLAYALTFDEMTLSRADLDRVREAAGRRGPGEAGRSSVGGDTGPVGPV